MVYLSETAVRHPLQAIKNYAQGGGIIAADI
jgi:hypothetical protein